MSCYTRSRGILFSQSPEKVLDKKNDTYRQLRENRRRKETVAHSLEESIRGVIVIEVLYETINGVFVFIHPLPPKKKPSPLI